MTTPVGVVFAVAASVLAASCAPVVSETAKTDGPTQSPSGTPRTAGREPEPTPAGAYTPFVYAPGQLHPVAAEGCRDEILAAGQDPSADWVPAKSSRNTYRRMTIARMDDASVRVECRFPDVVARREVTEPIATQAAGILQQCGSVAGYDFSGWSVVTSMAAAQGVEAVLVSTNGYTAYCSLQPSGWDSGSDQRVAMPESSDRQIGRQQGDGYEFGLGGSSLSIKTSYTPIEGQLWYGSGTLYDERGQIADDASRIVLTFSDNDERFVVPVVQGRWAARIHRHAEGPLGQYRAAIQNRQGEVLATHASLP